jgi:monothiol glutaredoxin
MEFRQRPVLAVGIVSKESQPEELCQSMTISALIAPIRPNYCLKLTPCRYAQSAAARLWKNWCQNLHRTEKPQASLQEDGRKLRVRGISAILAPARQDLKNDSCQYQIIFLATKPRKILMSIVEQLQETIAANPVLLFMKGSPQAPQCGFSKTASQILSECGVKFATVDVLANPEVRATLPSISNWPTFPQLFVNNELVGGCDILIEMHKSGELKTMLQTVETKTH